MSGWIKLHRQFVKWEWFTDVNTCHLFTYLLLEANHKETKWRGHTIMAGQLLTGRIKLAEATGLSQRNVRTAMDKLKSTGEVTSKSYSKYSIITVTNWSKYQEIDQQATSTASLKRPASDQQATTSNNVKNVNNEKKLIIDNGDFETFWNLYGKIGNKQQAIRSYNKSIKEGASYAIIIRGVEQYQSYCRTINQEQRFIKHASTWLNNKGWEDEYTIHEHARKQSADDNCTAGIILALREHAEQNRY